MSILPSHSDACGSTAALFSSPGNSPRYDGGTAIPLRHGQSALPKRVLHHGTAAAVQKTLKRAAPGEAQACADALQIRGQSTQAHMTAPLTGSPATTLSVLQ